MFYYTFYFSGHRHCTPAPGADYQHSWRIFLLRSWPHHTQCRGDSIPMGQEPWQIQMGFMEKPFHILIWFL